MARFDLAEVAAEDAIPLAEFGAFLLRSGQTRAFLPRSGQPQPPAPARPDAILESVYLHEHRCGGS